MNLVNAVTFTAHLSLLKVFLLQVTSHYTALCINIFKTTSKSANAKYPKSNPFFWLKVSETEKQGYHAHSAKLDQVNIVYPVF